MAWRAISCSIVSIIARLSGVREATDFRVAEGLWRVARQAYGIRNSSRNKMWREISLRRGERGVPRCLFTGMCQHFWDSFGARAGRPWFSLEFADLFPEKAQRVSNRGSSGAFLPALRLDPQRGSKRRPVGSNSRDNAPGAKILSNFLPLCRRPPCKGAGRRRALPERAIDHVGRPEAAAVAAAAALA